MSTKWWVIWWHLWKSTCVIISKIETVHVMSTSSNHGKNNLMHIFPQNFSHHSAEEGYSQSCWFIVYFHWWRTALCRVQEIRVCPQTLGLFGFRVFEYSIYMFPCISEHVITAFFSWAHNCSVKFSVQNNTAWRLWWVECLKEV